MFVNKCTLCIQDTVIAQPRKRSATDRIKLLGIPILVVNLAPAIEYPGLLNWERGESVFRMSPYLELLWISIEAMK